MGYKWQSICEILKYFLPWKSPTIYGSSLVVAHMTIPVSHNHTHSTAVCSFLWALAPWLIDIYQSTMVLVVWTFQDFSILINVILYLWYNIEQFKATVLLKIITSLYEWGISFTYRTNLYEYIVSSRSCSARNNSRPFAIFQPISAFGQPKFVLVSHISCIFPVYFQWDSNQ